MTRMIQNIAPVLMLGQYQLNDLIKCEGEVFVNFKKFNRAMISEINRIDTWKKSDFNKTEDLLELKVTSCVNVELFETIACSELGTLGCDHDLAVYPLIKEALQGEFRRTCTIAKGGEYYLFQFHRKGSIPSKVNLNQ